MFKFKSKKKEVKPKERFYSAQEILIILDAIQKLNNQPTPKTNNWKLR